jgi:hypothetical protein
MTEIEPPKVFISYSWSTNEHEKWVLDLATELEEAGIHVVIDKWELREGGDKYAFMEKMVTDKNIRKVIIICDKVYCEKADNRKGGVGTETQIISKEVYDQMDPTDQKQKFVAIITEKDEDGKPYIPTFIKSRIYIEMADPENRIKNFEQLVRWIFDKPMYQRPVRGTPPSYVITESRVDLGILGITKRLNLNIREAHPAALGTFNEFIDNFVNNFNRLRIEPKEEIEFDDQVIQSITDFLPYRDDLIELFLTIGRYSPSIVYFESLHRFFEALLPYRLQPKDAHSWRREWADNFCFITQELFIYCIAALLKTNRFDGATLLLEKEYYLEPGYRDISEGGLIPFNIFRTYLYSFEDRNKRLKMNRLSLTADHLVEKRAYRRDITKMDLMQADFVIWIRSEIASLSTDRHRWWPDTLLYAQRLYRPFEIFARSKSASYFENIKPMLGVNSKEDYLPLFENYRTGTRKLPTWDYENLDVVKLMNFDNLATSS